MERRQKNISHLMTSQSLLPGPTYSVTTPKTVLPQRSHNSLIKTICGDCINSQQINARKQLKESELSQDRLRLKQIQAQDQKRRIQDYEKKQATKNQLSVDLRGLIENQQKERKSIILKQKKEHEKLKNFFENQQKKVRFAQQQRNKSVNAMKEQLKSGLQQQIKQKSKEKSRKVDPSQGRSSVSSLIPDKRQFKASQQNYHKELDVLNKKKKQEQKEKRKLQIQNERKRLKQVNQREVRKACQAQQELKGKVIKQRQTMYQNVQMIHLKKSEAKKIRQSEKEQFNKAQQRLLKQQKQNKVCIELRQAMLKAERDKENSRQLNRSRSNHSDFGNISLTQPIKFSVPQGQKACCEGCHKQKSISSFGNFII